MVERSVMVEIPSEPEIVDTAQEVEDRRQSNEKLLNPLQQVGSSSSPAIGPIAKAETAIVIEPAQTAIYDGNEEPNSKTLESTSMAIEENKVLADATSSEKQKHVMDECCSTQPGSENFKSEKVCRICQLSSELPLEASNLIQLGCGCKGDLAISHRHCAKAWFKRKGNRQCEICGETAINVTGIDECGFRIEYMNDVRLIRTYPPEREDSSSCKRSCCNFFVGCLVLAFIVLWFFRVGAL